MLARSQRLRKTAEIERVYRRGSFGMSGAVQAKVFRTAMPANRAAVVVGKKVSKKATERNRIRRRVAEILRTRWETLPAPYDIVVTVRDVAAAGMPAEQLQADISRALERAMRPGTRPAKGRAHV